MTLHRRTLGLLGALSALALGACADTGPSSPLDPSQAPSFASGSSATLVECETLSSVTATDTIDLLGGRLAVTDSAGGVHEVVFPENAVTAPTIFTMTVPASKYVEVRVTAKDLLTGETYDSLVFPVDAQPTLAISYKRCTRFNVTKHDLGLYHIDEVTDALLAGPFGSKEGSTTDPRVKGRVPHFTDYAIGAP